jgi:hypothetical protein
MTMTVSDLLRVVYSTVIESNDYVASKAVRHALMPRKISKIVHRSSSAETRVARLMFIGTPFKQNPETSLLNERRPRRYVF